MHPPPSFTSTRREKRWLRHVSRNYTINLHIEPCVFQVPQSLREENPRAYTPQLVGLGPFHHLCPEVQEMENLKRTLVKAFLKVSDFQKFIQFVDEAPRKLEPRDGLKNFQSTILPYYDRYLDLESKTLMWILAIDGIFLLQFLKEKSRWEDRQMVADVMKLENQIPLVLLKNIRDALEESFPGGPDLILWSQFFRFCKEQSPLRLRDDPEWLDTVFTDAKHLLDFLYLLIVENYQPREEADEEVPPTPRSFLSGIVLKQAISIVLEFTVEMAQGIVTAMGQAKSQGLRVPQRIDNVSKILEQLQQTTETYEKRDKDVQPQSGLASKIDVPSVSQLYQIGNINFACADGGIRNILFDDGKNTLYLPEIRLCDTSEVVLRNLVAYEAASKPVGSVLEFTEYVDLMCGIINSVNDVKLLKRSGIIKGKLLSEEIVRIFNGINKSIQIPDEQSEIQRTMQQLSKLLEQSNLSGQAPEENSESESIKVPSVSELEKAAIKFACTNGTGNRKILLDKKGTTLYLPEINLGNNPIFAVRRLDRYEAEYVDFMCSIIKDVDDVAFLKRSQIIKGNLPDEEIARVFNQKRRDIEWPKELTLVQETVHKLNIKFRNLRMVKAYKFFKTFFEVFQVWVKRLFPTLVLLLLIFQSACQVYNCRYLRSVHATASEAKRTLPRKVLGEDHYNLM